MSSIDKRIVEMSFENQQFEKGVKSSIQSLENLKKGLDLDGATKSLDNLGKTSKGFSLAGIAEGVEKLSSRFSALGIIGITALQNITNSAINAGKALVSSLMIDPVTVGFHEYELKMDSVQTIMAGTGESLKTVSKYLEDLNVYADRTIYSFADMTSNIGKFTNAGVSLHDAVAAIQGISNAAALSGSNATQASHAMYNFAQALAAGHVKLIDWKSIETANMATVQFKNELIKTAVAAGTLKEASNGMYQVLSKNGQGATMKETISATKNFNDSLQYQWMTTDVLIETLSRYSDETTEIGKRAYAAAQDVKTFTQLLDTMREAVGSGWGQTWEILIGDFHEAKEALTELSNAANQLIDSSSDARNKVLADWKALGGRKVLIDGIRDAIKGIISVVKPVSEAFREIFPPKTAQQLLEMTKNFRNLMSTFKLSEQTSDNLKRTFKGLFAVLDIIGMAFTSVVKAIAPLVSTGGGGITALTGKLGDLLVYLRDVIKESGIFNKILKPISDGLLVVFTVIGNVSSAIWNFLLALKDTAKESTFFQNAISYLSEVLKKVSLGIEKVVDVMREFGKGLGEIMSAGFERLKTRFEGIGKLFSYISDKIKESREKTSESGEKFRETFTKIGQAIGNGIKFVKDKIVEWLKDFTPEGAIDAVNAGLLGMILLGIKKFISTLTGATDDSRGIVQGIKGIVDNINNILSSVTETFEALQAKLKADVLMKIASAIAILTGAVLVLSLIDPVKLTAALTAITVLLTDLFVSLAVFEKIMKGAGFKGIVKVTGAMISLSAAVLLLSFAMKSIASLNWEEVGKGLAGVGGLLLMLVGAMKILSTNQAQLVKGSVSMIALALSVTILSRAVKKLGSIDTDVLVKGLTAIGVILLELLLFMKMTNVGGLGFTQALGILALSESMVIFAKAVRRFGEIDTDVLIKGIAAMGVVLTELLIFMKLMGNTTKTLSNAVALTIIATSMLIFGKSLQTLGGMSWEEIAKGLIAMGGALAIIVVSLNLMPSALPGAAALLVVAAALSVLTPVLIALGAMPWEGIAKGLTMLAGVFLVLGVAGLVLTPLAPVILALSVAIALLGVGVVAAGAGLVAFAAGFTALSAAVALGGTALVLFVNQVISLIPQLLKAIGQGVVEVIKIIGDSGSEILKTITTLLTSVAQAIIDSTPKLIEAFVVVLTAILNAIIQIAPLIGETFTTVLKIFLTSIIEITPLVIEAMRVFLTSILETIIEVVPLVVDAITTLIESLLDAAIRLIPKLVDLGVTIIVSILKGIADNIQKVVELAIDIVVNFIKGVASKIPDVIQSAFDLIISFINGLADAIRGNTATMITAVNNLMEAIVDAGKQWLTNSISGFKDVWRNIMESGFVQGIKDKIGNVVTTIKEIPSKALEAIKEFFGNFKTRGGEIVTNIKDGVSGKISSVITAIKEIPTKAISALKESLNRFKDIGGQIINGLRDGIKNGISKVTNAAREVAKSALNAAKNFLGIKSPSKEFEQIGKYANEGFAGGLTRFADVVVDSAKDVGQNTIDALSRSISNIADVIDSDVEFNPVLRPVVDLSDVNDDISSAFANPRILKAVASYDKAVTATARNNNVVNPRPNSGTSGGPDNTVINNSFTVHAVIREEADIQKVSRGLFELQRRASRTAGLVPS